MHLYIDNCQRLVEHTPGCGCCSTETWINGDTEDDSWYGDCSYMEQHEVIIEILKELEDNFERSQRLIAFVKGLPCIKD